MNNSNNSNSSNSSNSIYQILIDFRHNILTSNFDNAKKDLNKLTFDAINLNLPNISKILFDVKNQNINHMIHSFIDIYENILLKSIVDINEQKQHLHKLKNHVFINAVAHNNLIYVKEFLEKNNFNKIYYKDGLLISIKYNAIDILEYFMSLEKEKQIPKTLSYVFKETVDYNLHGYSGTRPLTFLMNHPKIKEALPHIRLLRKPFLDVFEELDTKLMTFFFNDPNLKQIIKDNFDPYILITLMIKTQSYINSLKDNTNENNQVIPASFQIFLENFNISEICGDKLTNFLKKKEHVQVRSWLEKCILNEKLDVQLNKNTNHVVKNKI